MKDMAMMIMDKAIKSRRLVKKKKPKVVEKKVEKKEE